MQGAREKVSSGRRLSRRRLQRLKTEVELQRVHQLPIFRGGPLQAEPGVVMVGRCVFMAPQAAALEVYNLVAATGHGNFQAQIEIGTDHHRQLADKHQSVFGDVPQKADGFVGNAVEHSQKIRQLMPLDPADGEHAEFATQGP